MNSHALLSHAAAFALRVAAPLMAIVPNARADGAPKADPARLEEPTHGPFEPCASCKDFTIGTRPWDGKTGNHGVYDLWMRLPGTGRSEYRIAPTQFADGKNDTLDASCPPDEGLVSPDARWVAFSQKYCRSYAVAFVLQRDPVAGMKPLPSLVSELGWERFFVDHPDAVKRRGQMSGITNYVESSICDLVAWEADSSGVWFALRGGDRRGTGIYRWYFLWDAVTGKVRVPERVRAINKQAAVRWSSDERPLSADEIAMEAEHIVFLAELEWKLSHRRKK